MSESTALSHQEKVAFAAMFLFVAFVAFLLCYWLLPAHHAQVWRDHADNVRKGQALTEILGRLGTPDTISAGSHFQTDWRSKDVEQYYSWRRSGFEIEIGVRQEKVFVVHYWVLSF